MFKILFRQKPAENGTRPPQGPDHTERGCWMLLPLLLLLAVAGCTHTKPKPPASPQASAPVKEAPPAPPTHTMSRPAPKSKPQLDAVFEAVEMAPVKLETKTWTDLTILEALPHGARVHKGDTLVKLDTEKLKDQIEDLERDRLASKLTYQLAEAELENLKETTPLKLEAAKRSKRVADEDLAYFEKTGRAAKEKSARFGIKNAEQRLDGAKEELRQLEKMYKADDLVEDTEEIILRRQRFALESAEYGLDLAKEGAAYSLNTSIPREAESLKASKRDQGFALDLAKEHLPRNLAKKRLDLEKLKRDQKKSDKKLSDLKLDLDRLENIHAPMGGVVYYGACEAGKWTTGAALAKKLFPTGKLPPNEVFMTIVNPDRLLLRAVVQEGDLGHFAPGVEGKASPVSLPDKKLPVKLEELGGIPIPAGGFEARFSVEPVPDLRLMPGMNCKISLTETQPPDLRAPKEAVFAEGDKSFVFVLKGENQHEKRTVKTGASDGKTVEILQGLSEGEKIFLSRPK